jgi:hypothetical protein
MAQINNSWTRLDVYLFVLSCQKIQILLKMLFFIHTCQKFVDAFRATFTVFFVKGPAADATDAPQSWGLLCNPVMKMNSFFFFSFFHVMEHRWNEIDRGKPEVLGKKPVPIPFCPSQIPRGLTRDQTRAYAVRGRRLTAWAMARPLFFFVISYRGLDLEDVFTQRITPVPNPVNKFASVI